MPLHKKPRLEVVRWEDHCSMTGGGWKDIEEIQRMKALAVLSVGWVIAEDEHRIILVSQAPEETFDQVAGEICILKPTIKRRWKIADPSGV